MRDDEFFRNEDEITRSRKDAKIAKAALQAAIEKHVADPVARKEIESRLCEFLGAFERNAMSIAARNEARDD